MGNQFASKRNAISICDRCGEQWMLKELRREIVKQRYTGLLMCPDCWDPDQPQLMLGTFPVDDPQGLQDARPDTTYLVSGTLADGSQGEGSRVIQWGWNPVGGGRGVNATLLTPNDLIGVGAVGTVTIPNYVLGVQGIGNIGTVTVAIT